MRKTLVAGLLTIAILMVVAGCTFFQTSPLHVAMITKYAHPVTKLGGFPVTLRVDGGPGQYTVNWGDGVINQSLSHLYVAPIRSQYTITVTSGSASKVLQLHVPNSAPVIYPPFLVPSTPGLKSKTLIDLRYREHGCHNGMPVAVSGIRDPDGDKVSVIITITTNGVPDAVYNANRQPIQGKLVPVGVYYWFPGWGQNTPPYPFGPQSVPTATSVIHIVAIDQWGAKTTASFHVTTEVNTCQGGTK